jgi:hypothetical protein
MIVTIETLAEDTCHDISVSERLLLTYSHDVRMSLKVVVDTLLFCISEKIGLDYSSCLLLIYNQQGSSIVQYPAPPCRRPCESAPWAMLHNYWTDNSSCSVPLDHSDLDSGIAL